MCVHSINHTCVLTSYSANIRATQGPMEFSNTLPGERTPSNKDAPHISTATRETPPSYSASGPEPPRYQNVRWTTVRCARYDRILHIISLGFGVCTLVAYAFDLGKSCSYHVKVPVSLVVVDSMSIGFLFVSNCWSLIYLLSAVHTRMSRGDLGRKWPTIFDAVLHCCLLGVADTTLSMRSGGDCDTIRAVGGCAPSRKSAMIAAGVGLILVA